MNKMYTLPLFLLAALVFGGCQEHDGSEDQLQECVDSFAVYYYNWHLDKAARFCTADSRQWLQFAASNVHQEDLDTLHNKAEDAQVEIGDISQTDDNSATAEIHVSDFLQMDTIGQPPTLVDEADFTLQLVMEQGKWRVRMEGLPRSGKQSRD